MSAFLGFLLYLAVIALAFWSLSNALVVTYRLSQREAWGVVLHLGGFAGMLYIAWTLR